MVGLVEVYKTNNVFELCDCLGISIIQKKLENRSSLFYRAIYGDEYIIIDCSVSHQEKKALIAHELGHAILHVDFDATFYNSKLTNKSKLERQANIFAAELLTLDVDEFDLLCEGLTYKEIAANLEVSETLLKYKII